MLMVVVVKRSMAVQLVGVCSNRSRCPRFVLPEKGKLGCSVPSENLLFSTAFTTTQELHVFYDLNVNSTFIVVNVETINLGAHVYVSFVRRFKLSTQFYTRYTKIHTSTWRNSLPPSTAAGDVLDVVLNLCLRSLVAQHCM